MVGRPSTAVVTDMFCLLRSVGEGFCVGTRLSSGEPPLARQVLRRQSWVSSGRLEHPPVLLQAGADPDEQVLAHRISSPSDVDGFGKSFDRLGEDPMDDLDGAAVLDRAYRHPVRPSGQDLAGGGGGGCAT